MFKFRIIFSECKSEANNRWGHSIKFGYLDKFGSLGLIPPLYSHLIYFRRQSPFEHWKLYLNAPATNTTTNTGTSQNDLL